MNPESEWSLVKWSPEVRLAVREVRQRGSSRSGVYRGRHLVEVRCPGQGGRGGQMAGVVYVTSQGPLLLGVMAPSLPRDMRVDDARNKDDAGNTGASQKVSAFSKEWTTEKGARNDTSWPAGEIMVESPAYLIDSETRSHVPLQARCGRLVVEVGALRDAIAEAQRLLDAGRPKVLTLSARRS